MVYTEPFFYKIWPPNPRKRTWKKKHLKKGIYWGYNPLILTFYPNFPKTSKYHSPPPFKQKKHLPATKTPGRFWMDHLRVPRPCCGCSGCFWGLGGFKLWGLYYVKVRLMDDFPIENLWFLQDYWVVYWICDRNSFLVCFCGGRIQNPSRSDDQPFIVRLCRFSVHQKSHGNPFLKP